MYMLTFLINHPFFLVLLLIGCSWVFMQLFFAGIAWAMGVGVTHAKAKYDSTKE